MSKLSKVNMTENKEELYYKQKQLSKEGIKALKDVNKTYEFYDRYREIIVSKKVAQVIRENVPDVEFYPVFRGLRDTLKTYKRIINYLKLE